MSLSRRIHQGCSHMQCLWSGVSFFPLNPVLDQRFGKHHLPHLHIVSNHISLVPLLQADENAENVQANKQDNTHNLKPNYSSDRITDRA